MLDWIVLYACTAVCCAPIRADYGGLRFLIEDMQSDLAGPLGWLGAAMDYDELWADAMPEVA